MNCSHALFSRVCRTGPASEDEKATLLEGLKKAGRRTAILAVRPGLSEAFVPKAASVNFPMALQTLYNEDTISMTLPEVLSFCEATHAELSASQEQIAAVEAATRQQADSKIWYRFRAGRITASRFKAVCHARTEPLPRSLITSICYPQEAKFTTKATEWGCKNECRALAQVEEIMAQNHVNFTMTKCGFIIQQGFHYIGATPDAMVNCDCCGKGCIEVKCPYCMRSEDISNVHLNFFDGDQKLKNNHAYYYQVQCQMATCSVPYCDFVVWTEKGIAIQRLEANEDFFF